MVEYSKKMGISRDLIPVLKGYFNLSNAYFGSKARIVSPWKHLTVLYFFLICKLSFNCLIILLFLINIIYKNVQKKSLHLNYTVQDN